MQYLTIWDFILAPIFILVLTYIAKRYRDKHYPPGHPLRDWYLKGLYAKFGGAIAIALIYQYYYGGGDTFNFFYHAKVINSALSDSVVTWFHLITRQSPYDHPDVYAYSSRMFWYYSPQDYLPGVIAALLGLFTGTTYLPTALLFAFLAYTGIWAMFKAFAQLYPQFIKYLAWAFLFIPTTVVWGSAIFKDTVCMFGLGWMTYSTFSIFVGKNFRPFNIIMLVLSFYLISVIKLYILMAFLPALFLWLLMTYSKRIKVAALRWVVNIGFVGLIVLGFVFIAGKFSNELNKYSLEEITSTVQITQSWTSFAAGDEGSVYSIGEFDGSIGSMISLFPQAVVVTLFRPFLWESRKVIIFLTAIEALVFLYFTLKMIFNRKSFLKIISKDPNLIFFLTFALIFAFAVGISSGNFGALSRYKIPCLPFFGALLMIVTQTQAAAKKATAGYAGKKRRLLAPQGYRTP